jgi:cytidine deaminase
VTGALPDDLTGLVDEASALVRDRAADPTHTVAAAVLTDDGTVATGLNLYHFTGGPCAELVALANAAATTTSPVRAVVAVGDRGRGVLAPCGRCRQVLADLFPEVTTLVPGPDGPRVVPVPELLPASYAWAAQDG